MDMNRYNGIIPAFYACYDKNGDVNPETIQKFTQHLINKGVKGLYVGGSSGECIYQSVYERKITLENVLKVAKGKITVIAHVACNNTTDSMELAAHAESLGVDAIAAIPPIYFKLPEYAIAKYWNDISSAAPNTDFIIYNIPQLAGVALTESLYKTMLLNKNVIGVKNSSMPSLDIQNFKALNPDGVVFNGPDEQLASGIASGADGGIGGTYGVMPELYIELFRLMKENKVSEAVKMQADINKIIFRMCSCKGNLYAVMKKIILIREGFDFGGVRAPLFNVVDEDKAVVDECIAMINATIEKYIN